MKSLLLFLFITIASFYCHSGEEDNIKAVINDYFDAYSDGNLQRINQIFHPELIIKYLDPESKQYSTYTMQQLSDFMSNLPKRWKVKGKVHSVRHYKSAAQVHATIVIGSGKLVWTDFIGMLKIDGVWKVVSKVSHGDKIKLP